MKNVIYWFSGTGNSLVVAMDLAKALGNTELIPIARIINRNIPSSERMGMVFSVYAFGLPIIVRRFLQRAPVASTKYIYTVATMGGLAGAVHLLAKRGATLASGWSIVMPGNYPVLSGPPPAEKQTRIFAKAQQRIGEVAAQISAGATGIYEDTRAPLGWLLAPIHKPAMNRFPESDSNFVVGKNCKHCALCRQSLPGGKHPAGGGPAGLDAPLRAMHGLPAMVSGRGNRVWFINRGKTAVSSSAFQGQRSFSAGRMNAKQKSRGSSLLQQFGQSRVRGRPEFQSIQIICGGC